MRPSDLPWPRRVLHRILVASTPRLVVGTALLVGIAWALDLADVGPPPVSPLAPALLNGSATLAAAAMGAAWLLWGRRRPTLLADLTVIAVAGYVAGSLIYLMADTPWGLWGLFGDQAFRNEAVTRFSQEVASADYAYRGLPAHYPPLVPWLEGRVADLVGMAGWRMVKIGQIVLAALLPLLSYATWRRVVPPPAAAAVVAFGALVIAEYNKADQWAVLAIALPWWVDAFRRGARDAVRPWPAWVHGIVAGLLVTTYSFYFLPLAAATVAGFALDVYRREPWRLVLLRPLVITAVGLVVSAWYWVPMLRLRLTGAAFDDQQTRWFSEMHAQSLSPMDPSLVGALGMIGLVYLATVGLRRRSGEALLLALFGGYVVLGGGLVLTALGSPILAFKAVPFIQMALATAGLIGIWHAGRLLAAGGRAHLTGIGQRGTAVALTMFCLGGALWFVSTWTDDRVHIPHATTLPDGSQPEHAADLTPDAREGLPNDTLQADSVDQILSALGASPTDTPVLVTHRTDLLATTTAHPFVTWMSIYSNPFGQFDQRVDLLRQMARTSDPAEFVELATQNPYDTIDGFVLNRGRQSWVARVRVDDFPDRNRLETIEFDPAQFDHPHWQVRLLSETVVVTTADSQG